MGVNSVELRGPRAESTPELNCRGGAQNDPRGAVASAAINANKLPVERNMGIIIIIIIIEGDDDGDDGMGWAKGLGIFILCSALGLRARPSLSSSSSS